MTLYFDIRRVVGVQANVGKRNRARELVQATIYHVRHSKIANEQKKKEKKRKKKRKKLT